MNNDDDPLPPFDWDEFLNTAPPTHWWEPVVALAALLVVFGIAWGVTAIVNIIK